MQIQKLTNEHQNDKRPSTKWDKDSKKLKLWIFFKCNLLQFPSNFQIREFLVPRAVWSLCIWFIGIWQCILHMTSDRTDAAFFFAPSLFKHRIKWNYATSYTHRFMFHAKTISKFTERVLFHFGWAFGWMADCMSLCAVYSWEKLNE